MIIFGYWKHLSDLTVPTRQIIFSATNDLDPLFPLNSGAPLDIFPHKHQTLVSWWIVADEHTKYDQLKLDTDNKLRELFPDAILCETIEQEEKMMLLC